MIFDSPKNPNYAASVVPLKDFVELANCDNVKHALLFGNAVVIGKETTAGELGVFFPVETQLSNEFLSNNNLLRKSAQSELCSNVDPEKSGFFEAHGRVKAVKFRGHKSEGFWIPVSSLEFTGVPTSVFQAGDVFDKIGDHEICRKYIPKRNPAGTPRQQARQARLEDSIVDGQFRFHPDTENLRRNIHKINPSDYLSISDKWHGTSVVIAKILVKRELNWFERLAAKFLPIQTDVYGLTYSSRKVIKAVNGVAKGTAQHFYSSDIWGDVAKEVEDRLPEGFTIYGEIVGFTKEGSPIQSGYHYGCGPNQHRLLVYRATVTTPKGQVVELSWPQLKEFCTKYGFEMVREILYGRAGDFTKTSAIHWHEELLHDLEACYVSDGLCPFNNNEVPAEGVVVRVDHLHECEAYKLKNFRFLERETKLLDKGELDVETAQSEGEDDNSVLQTAS